MALVGFAESFSSWCPLAKFEESQIYRQYWPPYFPL